MCTCTYVYTDTSHCAHMCTSKRCVKNVDINLFELCKFILDYIVIYFGNKNKEIFQMLEKRVTRKNGFSEQTSKNQKKCMFELEIYNENLELPYL